MSHLLRSDIDLDLSTLRSTPSLKYPTRLRPDHVRNVLTSNTLTLLATTFMILIRFRSALWGFDWTVSMRFRVQWTLARAYHRLHVTDGIRSGLGPWGRGALEDSVSSPRPFARPFVAQERASGPLLYTRANSGSSHMRGGSSGTPVALFAGPKSPRR